MKAIEILESAKISPYSSKGKIIYLTFQEHKEALAELQELKQSKSCPSDCQWHGFGEDGHCIACRRLYNDHYTPKESK
jgi:hypothetical protein